MKIIQFNSLGSAENKLYISEVDSIEKVEEDEVLIEILYFPINPADLLLVEGKYSTKPSLPSKIGAECIARVKKIGSKVTRFSKGDIVLPLDRNTWTEEKIVNQDLLIKIDSSIDLLQASMLKVNPATAYLMLNNYVKIDKGDFIIQNASNSGVGNYVIQLSKIYGIKTINLLRRIDLKPKLKNIGADYVFDYNLKEAEIKFIKEKKIKLFLDAVAGKKVNSTSKLLDKNSTIINYGLLESDNIEVSVNDILFRNIVLKGFWLSLWLERMDLSEKSKLYQYLANLIQKKLIFTDIQNVFFIDQIKEAVVQSSKYKRNGKILVTPSKELYNNWKKLK